MDFSEQTIALLDRLERLARTTFSCRNDIAVLIELAYRDEKLHVLDELSFYAKFSTRTFSIMNRIGRDAEGFDKLSKEFGEGMEKGKILLDEVLAESAEEERQKFHENYLALSPASYERLLSLFRELSWYKNYLIDSRER